MVSKGELQELLSSWNAHNSKKSLPFFLPLVDALQKRLQSKTAEDDGDFSAALIDLINEQTLIPQFLNGLFMALIKKKILGIDRSHCNTTEAFIVHPLSKTWKSLGRVDILQIIACFGFKKFQVDSEAPVKRRSPEVDEPWSVGTTWNFLKWNGQQTLVSPEILLTLDTENRDISFLICRHKALQIKIQPADASDPKQQKMQTLVQAIQRGTIPQEAFFKSDLNLEMAADLVAGLMSYSLFQCHNTSTAAANVPPNMKPNF